MTSKREPPFKLDISFGEALARFAATRPGEVIDAVQSGKHASVEPSQGELQLVHYQTPEYEADFRLDPSNETIWITQQQMAELYGVDRSVISRHLKNIFETNELDMAGTCALIAQVRSEGGRTITRNVEHFNLDAILSVGYRVNSKRATAFRQYATGVLKSYITQGYALNEHRLRDDPHALRELAAKVRALRASEKTVYEGVRDVFAFGSVDYDKTSPLVRSFYAKLQDKFLHAVTGKTAAEIKLERADHTKPAMGLTDMRGDYPARSDIDTGKNYLNEDELYALHILCEQFLLFVESKAIRGQTLTMAQLSTKFDELLRFQGHAVFSEYREYLVARAKAHAHKEFDAWRDRVKLIPADRKRIA